MAIRGCSILRLSQPGQTRLVLERRQAIARNLRPLRAGRLLDIWVGMEMELTSWLSCILPSSSMFSALVLRAYTR